MPTEEILKISQGLLTPVIGIVATYILIIRNRRSLRAAFHFN
jgi:hypothetical protein